MNHREYLKLIQKLINKQFSLDELYNICENNKDNLYHILIYILNHQTYDINFVNKYRSYLDKNHASCIWANCRVNSNPEIMLLLLKLDITYSKILNKKFFNEEIKDYLSLLSI
jgi:hypothetical protein